jgi:GrpB-like predicted nucleotidyltransferase (UPF0157 family)
LVVQAENLSALARAARLIRELKASGCHDPRETIEAKIRRMQALRSPELPERVRAQRVRDPLWPVLFAAEAARVRSSLGEAVTEIEHFGSSAISSPHLSSKNVIDFLVAVDEAAGVEERSAGLTDLGYECYGNGPCDPESTWWWRIEGGEIAYVAHVCAAANPWIRTAVNFRDYLRASPDECTRYEARKRQLAAEPGRSLFEYSIGKLRIFYELSAKANAWRAAADAAGAGLAAEI